MPMEILSAVWPSVRTGPRTEHHHDMWPLRCIRLRISRPGRGCVTQTEQQQYSHPAHHIDKYTARVWCTVRASTRGRQPARRAPSPCLTYRSHCTLVAALRSSLLLRSTPSALDDRPASSATVQCLARGHQEPAWSDAPSSTVCLCTGTHNCNLHLQVKCAEWTF